MFHSFVLLGQSGLAPLARQVRVLPQRSEAELSARCRVNDERHIKILERIAQFSPNEGYQLTAIRDLFDRGRQAIEGTGPGGAIPFTVQLPVVVRAVWEPDSLSPDI
jgi:hypothetical protein